LLLNTRLSVILVGALLSARDVGLFSLAVSLMGTVLLATQSLSISAVHRQYADEEDRAVSFTLDFARQSYLLAASIALVMAAIAYPLIVLLYGSSFASATLPFVILLLVAVATAVENPCRVLLVRLVSPLRISAVLIAAVAANCVLTVVLAEEFGIAGAAAASAVTYWGLAFVMLRPIVRRGAVSVRSIFARPRADDEAVQLFRSTLRRA
jgi:O-antigen/teichoic acid export membrane protein